MSNTFLSALQQTIGLDRVLTDPAECSAYSYDNSRRQVQPSAVVLAENSTHLQQTVRVCYDYDIPLTVRGRATGTPGGAVPVPGGVVLSCERMQRIIKMDPANRLMIVEPGVTNQAVQTLAAQHGFFWPPDPSSNAFCTVGGNLGYNAAGPRAVKYGTTRENTLGLRAITGKGEMIRTGTQTTKGVVGYDLTRLLIGSEGTLAVIAEATLKLTPLPETKSTLQATYADIHAATQAVVQIMSQAVVPCALEFIDAKAIQLLRNYDTSLAIPAQAQALLVIEIDGLKSSMQDAMASLKRAATTSGTLEIKTAGNESESQQLWAARKALSPALRTLAPDKINEDIVVPVSRIPELLQGLDALSAHYDIPIVNFGHAGNGNFHVNLLINAQNKPQLERAHQCLSAVFDLVLKLDGTLSGEHGVGLEKREFITRELDAVSLHLMRGIKKVFDPKNILNPGKIFTNLTV